MRDLAGLAGGRLKRAAFLREEALGRALAALNGEGCETRLVGGAVRDLALGLEPGDLDLATTLPPDETMKRAAAAGFKVVPTGLAHGTVSLMMDGRTIEATTLREDVETDGRHARVAFGRDFASDARRRDFTINALSLDAEGRIFDPVGGREDLAAGRVRFIGEADERIREDRLRILRFFRFSARFGEGPLDRDGFAAAVRRRSDLGRLSRERVRAEVLKLLVAPRAGEVVRIMGECGLLGELLGFADPGRLARLAEIEAAAGRAPDGLLRLAGLALSVGEDADRLARRLRLSKSERERLAAAASALAPLHGASAGPPESMLRGLLFRFGRQAAADALLLAQAEADVGPGDPGFARARRFLTETSAPKPPIAGKDLIARGFAAGPEVGEILRRFRLLWEEAGFPTERERVEDILRAATERAGAGAAPAGEGGQ